MLTLTGEDIVIIKLKHRLRSRTIPMKKLTQQKLKKKIGLII